jgi:hypothetical protein
VLPKAGLGIRFNQHIEGDGPTVFARTISEACDYMTDMGRKRELRQHWQRACQLILAPADVFAVSRALELALFMNAKLDVSKVPAKMKTPRTHLATEARHHFIAQRSPRAERSLGGTGGIPG